MSRFSFYLGFVLSIVALVSFADIGHDLADDGWRQLEDMFAVPIHHLRRPWLTHFVRLLTMLGSFYVLALVVSLVLFWPGGRFGGRDRAVFLGLGLSEGALNGFLKSWYGRPRPGVDYAPLVEEKYFSFPSGHSMGSLCIYGFLAYLFCRRYPRWRWPVRLCTGVIVALVGLSRIYLAAHYPGDVVGGFAAGVPCLFLALVFHQGLMLAGKGEPDVAADVGS